MHKTSKNNISEIYKRGYDRQLRYGFRKLASGALVSAIIGGFFLVSSDMNVHASVTDPTGSMTAVVSQTTPADQKAANRFRPTNTKMSLYQAIPRQLVLLSRKMG